MADSGVPIASIQTLELELPPSCIEFCIAHPCYFVVGTYDLQKEEEGEALSGVGDGSPKAEADRDGSSNSPDVVKKPQSRNGSLVVFQVIDRQVSLVQTVSHPSAILDLHFQPQSDKQDVCGVVSSTGTLTIFRLSPTSGNSQPLRELNSLRLPDIGEDVLFTSFVWHPTVSGSLAVTTSTGEVHLAQLNSTYDALQAGENITITHSLEAWCVAFSPPMRPPNAESDEQNIPFTLYSGGDDSILRYISCRPEVQDVDDSWTVFHAPYSAMSVSGHGAGVTAILPLPLMAADGSHIVLTGSYDDILRIFAIKPLYETYGARQACLLDELDLGGGVWRIKLISLNADEVLQGHDDGSWRVTLLVSCMHAGARIIEIKSDATGGYSMEVLGRFEEHKSMNYGSDFQPQNEVEKLYCVSTSFYDKLLCVWEFGDTLIR